MVESWMDASVLEHLELPLRILLTLGVIGGLLGLGYLVWIAHLEQRAVDEKKNKK